MPGSPITRPGHMTSPPNTAGTAPDTTLIALIEFPSTDAARAFANDPDYAPLAQARQAGSEGHFWVIDDTDAAGSIPYLPKG